jgi:hypothetical protein
MGGPSAAHGDLCHTRLRPFRLPGRAALQLPDQSTILWVASSSTGDSRLRGALPLADFGDATALEEFGSPFGRVLRVASRSRSPSPFSQGPSPAAPSRSRHRPAYQREASSRGGPLSDQLEGNLDRPVTSWRIACGRPHAPWTECRAGVVMAPEACRFLGNSNGCGRMAARARARTICARVPRHRRGGLRLLTGEDLRELGVASIGHRRRLLDSIVTLDAGRSVTGAHPCVGCISKAEQRQLTVSGSARKGLDI